MFTKITTEITAFLANSDKIDSESVHFDSIHRANTETLGFLSADT